MSAQEVGLYTMLLCRMYEESGPIEDHALRLSTYCGMRQATFEKTLQKLVDLGKITRADGLLFNERARDEISNRAHDLKIASKAGKASAKKRQQNQSQCATPVQRPFNDTDTDTDTDTNVSLPKKPARKKCRIPENAVISDAQIRAAAKRGHSLQEAEAQFSKFKNDALAKGKSFVDWDRAFITWLDSEYFRPITSGAFSEKPTNIAPRRNTASNAGIREIAFAAAAIRSPRDDCF